MISLITPVHNTSSNLLRQFIHSIRVQTYKDWELCIANDCSSKTETIEFLKNLRSDKSLNVKIIDLVENVGIGEATQKAFEISTGEYIAFADSDDELHPQAFETALKELVRNEADLVYSDEAITNMSGGITIPHFKPDFSYETFLSQNYICHFVLLKRHIYNKVGGLRGGFDGSQDHDFLLRVTEKTRNIYHIPEVLYYWRDVSESITHASSTKDKVWDRGVRALEEHLQRRKQKGSVKKGQAFGSYVISYEIEDPPLVSIVIPFKDDFDRLKKCLFSISGSTYDKREVVIVNNNQIQEAPLKNFEKDGIKVVTVDEQFNFSRLLNAGVAASSGKYIITAHDDIKPLNNDWIETLLQHAQKERVGVVGAKLFNPNNRTQSVGFIIGIGGFFAPAFPNLTAGDVGYFCRAINTQNVSAVSSACMMFEKELHTRIGGFDEKYFKIDYADIDFCLRVQNLSYRNIITTSCLIEHENRRTRGTSLPKTVKEETNFRETKAIKARYNKFLIEGDPCYNKNLSKSVPFGNSKIIKNAPINGSIPINKPRRKPTVVNEGLTPPLPKPVEASSQMDQIAILKNPLVSIIVPVYDHYPVVVTSLLLQTYQNFEIIVVHDGPIPEDFKKIITGFDSSKIRLLNTSKRFDDWGHTPRSFGLRQVNEKSKFVVFTGADNYYVPKFLELMLAAFTNDQTTAAYCNLLHNYWDWTLINTKLVMGSIDCGCVMVRTEIAQEIGWKHRKHIADWLFMDELIKRKGKRTVTKVQKILFVHN